MTGVLVHEWIARAGGSENVLEAMSRIYPDADIYCLWNESTNRFAADRVRETWLARSPLRRSKAAALPFMPATWRSLRAENCDWALISSHLFAHHVNFGNPSLPRYVYVHTPARYIWSPELDTRGQSLPARAVAAQFKGLDRRRASEGAHFAANSRFVQRRIADSWGVDAEVIHPPVDVERIQSRDWSGALEGEELRAYEELPEQFVLGASRFIPYKRLEAVIRAGEVAGLPVVLAGRGPELGKLRAAAASASVPVTFVLAPSNELLWALYARATVYVFPAIEDFGIMPVEAMAAGAPVVVQAIGGAAESVIPGRTGSLAHFDSDDELGEAIDSAIAIPRSERIEHARRFSQAAFARSISEWVDA